MNGRRRLAIRAKTESERGAVIVLGAAAMTVILLVSALVIDLGSTRAQRASSQVVSDAAAAAGVVGLVDGGGPEGCASAIGYVESHLGTTTGADCSSFPLACVDTTPSTTVSATVDDYTVTITHPVDDDDPTMTPSGIGTSAQPTTTADGNRCDRLAVAVARPTARFFSTITGSTAGSTNVHTVARVSDEFGRNLIINLLLLERHECEALTVGGGGSAGGISVAPVTDPATGDIYPGRIALDSDGTVNCDSRGTIHVNGSGATIRADGEAGCADELVSGTGLGCGVIETYAPGTPGCNLPGCTNGGVIAPDPTESPRRLTRAPIDWQYNCKSSYPLSYEIRGCSDSGLRSSYIDDLTTAVAIGTSFQSYQDAGYPCQINGGPLTQITVPEGNWLVDCSDLRVQRGLTFAGGNIVFEGDITIGADGRLRINTANTGLFEGLLGGIIDATENSQYSAWVYMKDGTLSKGGSGSIELNNTMMYMSATSALSLGGGSGSMIWSAPTEGPFTNLALWSESSLDHHFSGSATLTLEGIFFTPLATIVYTGNGGQASVEAQFIANKATAGGNGSLRLAPRFDRSIKHPPPAITELLR